MKIYNSKYNMMRSLSILAITAACIGATMSCSHQNDRYTLNGNVDESNNEATVLLISMASGDTLAIDTVRDAKFQISGNVPTPELAQVRVGGRSMGNIVLEPGEISFSADGVSGTPLNDKMNDIYTRSAQVSELMAQAGNDSIKAQEAMAQYEVFMSYADSVMNTNLDNPVGASLMITQAYDMNTADLEKTLEEHPSLKAYNKITKILDQKKVADETGVGKKYKDFEVTYNGETTKLSDLIKPDHFTLVDFWASWCGPCRREIPVIKEILEEWGPKGLDVVGVAVWDEPANTEKAMEELGINWPVIINAQTGPTDLYGILGIPCIILIGPDGTILSRDLQDQELKDAVATAMSK